jgi:predicted aspartyl protease
VQRNVRAVVLDGARPDQVLLGMSFLGRVNLTNDGHRMTLRSKF